MKITYFKLPGSDVIYGMGGDPDHRMPKGAVIVDPHAASLVDLEKPSSPSAPAPAVGEQS